MSRQVAWRKSSRYDEWSTHEIISNTRLVLKAGLAGTFIERHPQLEVYEYREDKKYKDAKPIIVKKFYGSWIAKELIDCIVFILRQMSLPQDLAKEYLVNTICGVKNPEPRSDEISIGALERALNEETKAYIYHYLR